MKHCQYDTHVRFTRIGRYVGRTVRELSTGREKLDSMANTSRMTSYQRREQLIEIGRSLFASKGFEAVSVEEIAATAKVSKPIVYEHFGARRACTPWWWTAKCAR